MRLLINLALCVAVLLTAADQAIAQDEGSALRDGWRATVPMPENLWGDAGRYVIWVERGWLQVRRETANGQTDWHIVLARASDPKPPAIRSPKRPPEGTPRFEVSYREGRYFVREDLNVLRGLRELKPADIHAWPGIIIPPEQLAEMSSAGSNQTPPVMVDGPIDRWYLVAAGPREDMFDCWLRRLTPTELMEQGGGYGSWTTASGLRKAFAGQNWVLDDGELLVASRGSEAEILGKVVVGDPAPPLVARTLSGKPMRLDDYRGKYVLLDFWATWCGPCVEEIPTLQEVYQAFGHDSRFVMVSLSLDERADEPRNLVEKWRLPWVQTILDVDKVGGKVSQAYGVGTIPATFLIGPDGKVIAKGMRGETIKEAVRRALGDH